jgi:hypothetical protein
VRLCATRDKRHRDCALAASAQSMAAPSRAELLNKLHLKTIVKASPAAATLALLARCWLRVCG